MPEDEKKPAAARPRKNSRPAGVKKTVAKKTASPAGNKARSAKPTAAPAKGAPSAVLTQTDAPKKAAVPAESVNPVETVASAENLAPAEDLAFAEVSASTEASASAEETAPKETIPAETASEAPVSEEAAASDAVPTDVVSAEADSAQQAAAESAAAKEPPAGGGAPDQSKKTPLRAARSVAGDAGRFVRSHLGRRASGKPPRQEKPAGVKTHVDLKAQLARSGKIFRLRAFSNNIVLSRVLFLCVVLGATATLKSGVLVAVTDLAVTIVLYLIMASFARVLPEVFRRPAAVLVAMALVTPACWLAGRVVPDVTLSAGIFLPLTALCAAMAVDLESRGSYFWRPLADAAGDAVGFSIVMIVFSAIREVFGAGSIWGRTLPGISQIKINFVLLPPGAFLLLGLLLGAAQGIKIHKRRHAGRSDQ